MAPYASFYPHGPLSNPAAGQPDQLTIEYRPDDHLIAVRWVGTCSFERLREVYQRVGAMLVRTEAHRVLLDTREREIIGEEAARWVATDAYATLLEGRTTPLHLAYVVPDAVFEAFGGGPLETLGDLLRLGVFTSPGAATAWLLLSWCPLERPSLKPTRK